MSSNVDKVKVILRFNGEWVERNEGWDYVCTDDTVNYRVKLFSNGTHKHLLQYVQKKCGIDASVGQTKVVYKHDGEILMLTDDEDVSAFMEFAANSPQPPTLFVDVDYSMCDGGGTSNTTTQEGGDTQQQQQQQQEGQQQAVDEEEDRTTNRGCADDEAHVFNLSFAEVSTTTNQTVPYNRSSRVKKGQVFETKNEMIIELGIKCLQEGFEHRTHRSSITRYEVLCVNSGCAWRMTARKVGDNGMFHFGLSNGYATGWRARWNALDSIRGSPSESFTRLPAYLYNLELTNPGTQTSIRVDTEGRFEECFVALGVAIHTFLQNLRRVLIIDAAQLKGPYLGTMFLVVAMDGNNNIVAHCLRSRAASINAAITTIFPNSHHALCCCHLVMNVRSRDARIKVFKTPYWKACKAYTTYVFDRMMNILRVSIPDGARLMEEVGVERWSRVYFPGIRYNIMTSNSAESINAMSRFARRLPIVGLIEYFRAFQQEWYFIRRAKADSLDHPLTDGLNISSGRGLESPLHGLFAGLATTYGRYTTVAGTQTWTCINIVVNVDNGSCPAENYKATYIGEIKPVGPPETWQFPDTPLQSVRPPIIKKRRVGRPNVNARRPSRGEGSSLRRCPRCGDHGHKSDTCPLFPASSGSKSTIHARATRNYQKR
ncbi:hypothetical protein OSB04_012166 [Centaurea solstitialis]|uniref:CCHC-type domain-containing protein n=1 Tax=Centaurea solstitialis TaxID=347529 RepID=A0AA38WED2_9ASTR|nr:hypothetical protein OSB04_012166 [Centaurea solstitialis]